MRPDLSGKQRPIKHVLKWALVAFLLILGFVFIPAAIRKGYSFATKSLDIEAMKQRYWELDDVEASHPSKKLDAVYRRHAEVADWLEMRGITPDPGIRDEAVENAPFFIMLFGITRWQWKDLFRYWSIPSTHRTPPYLLSDVGPLQ